MPGLTRINRRQFLRTAGAAVALSAVAVACAPAPAPTAAATARPASQPTPAPQPSATPLPAATAKPAAKAPVDVGFYDWVSEDLAKLMISGFTKKMPNVTVTRYPYATAVGQTEEALLTKIAGGLKPDVISTHALRTPFFIRSKALWELSARADAGEALKGVDPSLIKVYSQLAQGKLYMAPYFMNPGAPAYNAAMVQSAGLDIEKPPTTWAEFFGWLETLKKTQKYPLYLIDQVKWGPNNLHIEPQLGMLTGKKVWPLVSEADATKTSLDSDAGIKVMDPFKALYEKDYVLPPPATGNPFTEGQVPIVWELTGFNLNGTEKAIGGRFEFRLCPGFFVPEGAKISTPLAQETGGYVLAIPTVGEHKDEAWEFVKHAIGKESQQAQLQELGAPVVRTDVDAGDLLRKHPTWKHAYDTWLKNQVISTPFKYNEVEDIIFQAWQQITIKKADVKVTFQDAAAKINAEWAKGMAG